MAIERIDKYTRKNVEDDVIFSDFFNNFNAHPNTGNVVLRTNVDAVTRSIKNVVLTRPMERFYNPDFGCDIHRYLFEPNDSTLRSNIKDAIKYSIETYEPRAKLQDIVVSSIDDLSVTVDIYFRVMRQQNVNLLQIKLDRVR